MKNNNSQFSDMPVGFAMSISLKPDALRAFAAMSDEKQDEILAAARNTQSKVEMEKLVAGIHDNNNPAVSCKAIE